MDDMFDVMCLDVSVYVLMEVLTRHVFLFRTVLQHSICVSAIQHVEKRRQPLTPSRRQHDTADGEGLVFKLRIQAHSTKSFSRKTSCLFLLICVEHI